jgi:hypothetical protein
MRQWRSTKPTAAPLGALGLVPILAVALLSVLVQFSWTVIQHISESLTFICFIFFPAGALLSIFSIFNEKSKLYGGMVLLLGAIDIWANPPALRFILFITIVYIPLGILLFIIDLVVRIKQKRQKRQIGQT